MSVAELVREGPALVRVPPATYLVAEGTGAPGSGPFHHALAGIYSVAHTLELQLEVEGDGFAMSALGALWWPPPGAPYESTPGDAWRWKLLLRVPDGTDAHLVRLVKESLVARRHLDDAADVRIEEIDEGDCVEAAHLGPYGSEGEALGRIHAFMVESHLLPAGPRHEIYVSDKTAEPGRQLTLIRQPVEG